MVIRPQARRVTRRSSIAVLTAASLTGCISHGQSGDAVRLKSRPKNAGNDAEPGLHPLKLRRERDALLYVPKSARRDQALPLLVYLHGATGSEQQGIRRFADLADQFEFALLSPASQGGT